MSKAKVFQTNDRIFAKVKGYPAWPACVTGPNDAKGSRYKVYFYGTYETAIVKKEDMWFFDDSTKAKFGKQKRKGFSEAIDEIENRPEVGYLTEESIPIIDEHEPLESGTGGDTILEESGVDASMLDESKDEEPVVTPAIPIPAQAPITKTIATSAKKGAKRKAAAGDSPAVTPAAKQAKISTPVASKLPKISTPVTKLSTPVTKLSKTSTPIVAATPPSTPGGTPSEEKTSRSGRVIKPKKFEDEKETLNQKEKVDDDEAMVSTPNVKSLALKKSERKMWVQIKATSDAIEINMDEDRPASFESKDLEVEWDRQTVKNALRFKHLVETGQFIPNEILQKLEAKANRTPEEEDILKHNIEISNIKEKMRWMKMEKRIVDLDIAIRSALHHEEPDMTRSISLISELQQLAIQPLMLKKIPNIVMTLRKVRKYIGPVTAHPDPKVNDKRKEEMQKVRLTAETAYKKIQSLFSAPTDVSFGKYFQKQVDEFQIATKDFEREEIFQLLVDPTIAWKNS